MKNLSKLAVLTALTLALGGSALAQGRPGGRPQGRGPRDARPPAGAPGEGLRPLAHLTKAYATVAPYDVNHDGKLDGTEKEALAKAIADGTIERPGRQAPPRGDAPQPGRVLGRIAGMYGVVAPYDANHDGELTMEEQSALKAAIEGGEIVRPGGRRGGQPSDVDGPRGPRGDRGPRADRGERSGRDDRGVRGDRGERGPRGKRGDRGDRGERPDNAERRGPRTEE